jgi:hypothetical protein
MTYVRQRHGFPGAAAVVALLTLLAGCQAGPGDAAIERLSKLPYPETAPYGDDLDIIVVQESGKVQVANRTPDAYEHVQLWLNQQYVNEVDEVAIGARNELPLAGFINYYKESFPRGEFLRPRRAAKVVLAEIYNPTTEQRHRLVVQPEYPKSLFNPLDYIN